MFGEIGVMAVGEWIGAAGIFSRSRRLQYKYADFIPTSALTQRVEPGAFEQFFVGLGGSSNTFNRILNQVTE